MVFIVLTNYMKLEEKESKTVISTAITISNKKSKYNNKTADQCTPDEIKEQIFLQLRESFPDLPIPTLIIISPGDIYEKNRWKSIDTAFITTSDKGFLPYRNDKIINMYNLGTHNGNSLYKFTSIESAVSNALVLANKLYPGDLVTNIQLKRSVTLIDYILLIIFFIFVFFTYRYIINK